MQKWLRAFNKGLEAGVYSRSPPLGHIQKGVAINTGPSCVGNMGPAHRFRYSALADEDCLSVRLGEEVETFGVDVIIVENIRAKPTGRPL